MTGTQTELYYINIQGLISKKKNKSALLKTLTTTQNKNKIIAITETHCTPKHHKGEILKFFPQYNMHRVDRNTAYLLDKEPPLKKNGDAFY